MNAHFWHAVLSVPDDEEAARMLDMLEMYEEEQWRLREAAELRKAERLVERLVEERSTPTEEE